jgi:hypothetical protein
MAFDWTKLREPAPETLVPAREAAHAAAQWATKAARANLPAREDDSHSALLWDPKSQALVTQPLKVEMRRGIRVGLDVAKLELVFFQHDKEERGESGEWLDEKLKAAGLNPASPVTLPYNVPGAPGKDPNLPALARWFAAGAEVLEQTRAKHWRLKPSPAWLWPHHFDMATLISFSKDKSIGVGVSMGDHYYAQPYAYISAYPAPKDPKAGALPPGGHWHTKDFFGAVATAEELLEQPDPRGALLAVVDAAFNAGRRWLDVPAG